MSLPKLSGYCQISLDKQTYVDFMEYNLGNVRDFSTFHNL